MFRLPDDGIRPDKEDWGCVDVIEKSSENLCICVPQEDSWWGSRDPLNFYEYNFNGKNAAFRAELAEEWGEEETVIAEAPYRIFVSNRPDGDKEDVWYGSGESSTRKVREFKTLHLAEQQCKDTGRYHAIPHYTIFDKNDVKIVVFQNTEEIWRDEEVLIDPDEGA